MECTGSRQIATQHAGVGGQYTVCPVCGRQFNNNAAGNVRPHNEPKVATPRQRSASAARLSRIEK